MLTALAVDPLDPDALNYTVPLTAPMGTEDSADTVVSIKVTAEDTTYNVYEVVITRPVEPDSDDVTLRTLTLTNPKNLSAVGLDPPFTAGTTTTLFVAGDAGTQRVGNDVTQVVVVAEPTDGDAQSVQLLMGLTDSGDRAALADGVTVDLAEPGDSTVLSIKVTAEDGSNATYVVTVTRAFPPLRGVTTLENLVLRDLSQTEMTLTPVFAQDETAYTMSVDHGVTKLEVLPSPTDADGATVEITGADAGGFVPLDVVGENVITVVVTAQNGTDTETYTVTVTRGDAPAADDATLSSLTLSVKDIGFTAGTDAYAVSVVNGVDETTVSAVAKSANAEVTITLGQNSATAEAAVSLGVQLAKGANEITVHVTPEDRSEPDPLDRSDPKVYRVTVNRARPTPGNTGNTGGSNVFIGSGGGGGGGSGTPDDTSEDTSEDTSDDDSDDSGYSDIGEADADHVDDINALRALGVLTGTECEENRICPNAALTRWVAAVWIVRVLDDSEPAAIEESRFSDVNASDMWEESHWFAPHVERLAELGITAGCDVDPARFCPDLELTRGQAVTWLHRAFDLASAASAGFTDTAGSPYEDSINRAVAAGVAEGCATNPSRFCPDRVTTRGELASFLNRAREAAASS